MDGRAPGVPALTGVGRRIARRGLGGVALLLAIGALALLPASPAGAHPLGNFTTNTSAAVLVGPDRVVVDYVVDRAEIPTLQERPEIDADGDDELSDAEGDAYAEASCAALADGLAVTVGGQDLTLVPDADELTFPPGQADLPTQRLDCRLVAEHAEIDARTEVTFADDNFEGVLGWREVIALGDETTIVETDVERESLSERLRAYPEERLGSPLRELAARIAVVPGGPRAEDPDEGASGLPLPSADRLTSLVSQRELTIPFALFALAVAFVLGGFHALAPGHGKTVMAAYLVGEQGARRQALLLGATVALTHTGGVFALALVVSNSKLAPDRLYPFLGSISGLLVAAIGVVLFRRAVRFRRIFPTLGPGASTHHHHGIGGHTHAPVGEAPAHSDDHDHGHDHSDGHDHDHRDDHTHGDDHDHDHGGGHDHDHDHGGGHDHDHDHGGGHDHDHEAVPATVATERATEPSHTTEPTVAAPASATGGTIATALDRGPSMRARNMMAMGFAGGLVPSPSALVVLLGSIAIDRAWFGLLLIIAYGGGLAAVLVGAGLLIERLRHRIAPLLSRSERPALATLAVNLPIGTAVLVVLGGLYLVVRALSGA